MRMIVEKMDGTFDANILGVTGKGKTKYEAIDNAEEIALAANLQDHRTLPDDRVIAVVPLQIDAFMTGVKLATQNNKGQVTLTYTDDTTETAQIDESIDGMDWFSIVGRVQDQRSNKEGI